ncbi:MAG: hypothetical protein KCHDKBKB_02563 [Elusimicrobia bacterium]|nr:hypothetical protein [Elusimicrobiota bacterium]
MKNTTTYLRLIVGLFSIVFVAGFVSGCNKKKDSSLTRSGGGVSSQSIVTLRGAAQ